MPGHRQGRVERHAFKARQRIGTVNSINWARVVAQVVYYFKGWLLATSGPGQKVSFCVPSGNFGNVCAGHIARMMGLPIDKLVVATNENDVLDEFFRTGTTACGPRPRRTHVEPEHGHLEGIELRALRVRPAGPDADKLVALFRDVDTKGGFDLAARRNSRASASSALFPAAARTDRLATIRDVNQRYGVTIDTHTADGVKVAREHLQPGVPMVVLETALPAKFADTIREALGHEPSVRLRSTASRSCRSFEVMPADADR
jgi:threonine synthase